MADMKGGLFKHDATEPTKSERVMPLFSLKGKTAIVSGAGAGIGLSVAQGLAEAGANVAIWYNNNKKALDRAAEIETEYGVKCANLSFPFQSREYRTKLSIGSRQGIQGKCYILRRSPESNRGHCEGIRRTTRRLCCELGHCVGRRTDP